MICFYKGIAPLELANAFMIYIYKDVAPLELANALCFVST
jgi:hypothetical protein